MGICPAPDRALAESISLNCWKAQLFFGLDSHRIIEEIEIGYRLGTPIAELVSSTMNTIKRLRTERGGDPEISFGHTCNQPREVFRFIVHLFSYRQVVHIRSNPLQIDVRMIGTLPPVKEPLFDDYTSYYATDKNVSVPSGQRIEWLGTQPELASLFYSLKKKGWIPDYKPYSLIQQAFTKSKTIDQIFRPGGPPEDATFDRISDKDFKAFEDIKPNRKKNT